MTQKNFHKKKKYLKKKISKSFKMVEKNVKNVKKWVFCSFFALLGLFSSKMSKSCSFFALLGYFEQNGIFRLLVFCPFSYFRANGFFACSFFALLGLFSSKSFFRLLVFCPFGAIFEQVVFQFARFLPFWGYF